MKMTREQIMHLLEDHQVKYVRLWFTDIQGYLKSFSISVKDFDDTLDHGKGFDGSSVAGYAEAHESDIVAMPDPDTFCIIPESDDAGREARVFCNVLNPDGSPHEGDPRGVLKRALAESEELGYTFKVGPEIEYFYFKNDKQPLPLDAAGYFDLTPDELTHSLRKRTIAACEAMGMEVECSHHEVAYSQHEIDPKYTDALTMADNVVTIKMLVKEMARKAGLHATFMPKPIYGVNGSGMHVHQSLWKGKRNAFFGKNDKCNLSLVAKQFIAGQLKHAREISLLLAQWVNSYKRLVPGYEAPVYVSWAQRNRTALIRVPLYRPGNEHAQRAEIRCPDPACNPYLAFAVMLKAGLEGIKNKYPLPDPVEPNIYEMAMEELLDRGLVTLPINLLEAIREMENSDLVRQTLGEHICKRLIFIKRHEWESYRVQVTSYEIDKYLPTL